MFLHGSMAKRALIVYGGWPGHYPVESSALWARELEGAGFAVTLSERLATFEEIDHLRNYDLIIPNWTMGELSGEQCSGLSSAVREGCGLGGWHGGMGDAFRACCQYQFITGGQFVAHPGGIRTYSVEIADQGHPITEGMAEFEMNSEQYYLHVDPTNRVLATTTFEGIEMPWIEGAVIPVAWVRRWGRGRVFYCSLGHQMEDFEVPGCREIIRRGLLWAARR